MKITDVKVGTRVMNKVNGASYEVVDVQKGSNISAVAVIIDPETNAIVPTGGKGYDDITISEKNAICFRITFWPKDETLPEGYTVADGQLLIDGKPVTEQGQIFVNEIISVLPGALLLAVKPREEKDELIDLFTYEPERDKFTKLIRSSSIPTPVIVKTLEEGLILGYNKSHEEKEIDEDGKETGNVNEVFDSSYLMLVKDGNVKSVSFDRPMTMQLIDVLGADNKFLIGTDKCVDSDGYIKDSKMYYEVVSLECDGIYSENPYRQPLAKILSAASVKIGGGIVLKGEDFILFNDLRIDSPLVKQIAGEYLVDVTYGEHEVTVTMADKAYNTASIIRKDTKDRGYIVSLA